MKNQFSTWLIEKIKIRGWSIRELARRSNLAHSSISRVISGETSATFDFCAAIARPLGESKLRVFQIAGLLDPSPENNMTYKELVQILENLTEEERLEVIRYAKYLMRRED